jgi:hypothetical protein
MLNNLLQLPNESLVRVTLDKQQSDLVGAEDETDGSDVQVPFGIEAA